MMNTGEESGNSIPAEGTASTRNIKPETGTPLLTGLTAEGYVA